MKYVELTWIWFRGRKLVWMFCAISETDLVWFHIPFAGYVTLAAHYLLFIRLQSLIVYPVIVYNYSSKNSIPKGHQCHPKGENFSLKAKFAFYLCHKEDSQRPAERK